MGRPIGERFLRYRLEIFERRSLELAQLSLGNPHGHAAAVTAIWVWSGRSAKAKLTKVNTSLTIIRL
ncbi:hypothetical protein BN77_4033 [Rhizobium mesoamericanum STM3625]|uniref:Uncharacterized protein n=1 Tax=Rhizobium mesoamericanum STM3625 TaxID=1211777 RepID=K0Q304_9HYPH|nr:hypothetical protein BN77_4033 [Rhizobium mesoamericanum STM3625]